MATRLELALAILCALVEEDEKKLQKRELMQVEESYLNEIVPVLKEIAGVIRLLAEAKDVKPPIPGEVLKWFKLFRDH